MVPDQKRARAPQAGWTQIVAWILLVLLAIALWMPRVWAHHFGINSNWVQAVLSATVAVAVVESVVMRSVRPGVVKRTKVIMIAFVLYLGLLEIGQAFLGRRAALSDWVINATVAAVAVILFAVYRRRLAAARPIPGISRVESASMPHRTQSRP